MRPFNPHLNLRALGLSLCVALVASLASGCGGGVDEPALSGSTLIDESNATSVREDALSISRTLSMTVAWVAPTMNDDGTPLLDLKGFIVLMGTQRGTYDRSIAVNDPKAGQFSIDGLTAGQYYVAVKAVNADGVESLVSAEAARLLQ